MKFSECFIKDLVIIEPDVFADSRGFFMESWHYQKFAGAGVSSQFVQQNHSRSTQWTLRGLHYQISHPQGKLVRVARGKVFDVAVDLRKESSTFGKWYGHILSDENHAMMWIPPGFAHGFLVMSAVADFEYSCTEFYSPEDERTVKWDDQEIGIEWPLPMDVIPVLSEKDKKAPSLAAAEVF